MVDWLFRSGRLYGRFQLVYWTRLSNSVWRWLSKWLQLRLDGPDVTGLCPTTEEVTNVRNDCDHRHKGHDVVLVDGSEIGKQLDLSGSGIRGSRKPNLGRLCNGNGEEPHEEDWNVG